MVVKGERERWKCADGCAVRVRDELTRCSCVVKKREEGRLAVDNGGIKCTVNGGRDGGSGGAGGLSRQGRRVHGRLVCVRNPRSTQLTKHARYVTQLAIWGGVGLVGR